MATNQSKESTTSKQKPAQATTTSKSKERASVASVQKAVEELQSQLSQSMTPVVSAIEDLRSRFPSTLEDQTLRHSSAEESEKVIAELDMKNGMILANLPDPSAVNDGDLNTPVDHPPADCVAKMADVSD